MDRGEYYQSYRIFEQLNKEYPDNRDASAYLSTARGMAFRQAIGRAERFLAVGDLDEFLASMKQAQVIQPSDRIRWVVQLVENEAKTGKSSQDIITQLKKAIAADVAPDTLEAVSRDVALQIKEKISAGSIIKPLGMLGITLGSTNTTADICVVVEGSIARELVSASVPILTRSKKDIDGMMKEIILSRSLASDSSSPVEVGRIAGAGTLLSGSLVRAGDFRYRLQIRCVDASTGEIKLELTSSFKSRK